MDTGSTAYVLICSALVLLMTPGLAMFYGGLVRRKNVANTMLASVFTIGTGIIMWVLIGFSLSFGADHFGLIGDLKWLGLSHVSLAQPYATGGQISNMTFSIFQMMFAVITPALITGAVAGRMKFKSLFIFVIVWSLIVYYPVTHMVWGNGGLLKELGALDFAGLGLHVTSGFSALILCIILGKRYDYKLVNYRIHNIPMVALGSFLLLFGWFGFNAGSALGINEIAIHSFMTTAVSTAAAMLSWMLCDLVFVGNPTLIGASTGLVAGLIGITPGAGFVPVWAAALIGISTSPICYFMISIVKRKFGYDDALDAFGCHGIGGVWGGICTGLFASSAVNPAVTSNGLFFGEFKLFLVQLFAIGIMVALAVIGTLVCYGITRLFGSIRVSEHDERVGLDRTELGEVAYPSFNGLD